MLIIMLAVISITSIVPKTTINVFAMSYKNTDSAVTHVDSNLPTITTTSEERDNHLTIVGIKHAKSFSPNPIDIKIGDTVTWTNSHRQAHTVTSETAKFDSGNIAPGQSFNHTFDKPGSFKYYCIIHPSMIGEVNVS